MSWRDVIVGLSLSASMLGVSALGACGTAEDGAGSGDVNELGDGPGLGGGSSSSGSGTSDRALEVVADSGGTRALGAPPYACASDATWQGWQAPPAALGVHGFGRIRSRGARLRRVP